MSEFLALDWEPHQLCGLEARVAGGRVRAERCFCLRWPEDPDPAQKPDEAGRYLRDQLDRAGVTARQLLVCVPRDAVVVRHLELPHVPDDELPDLVKFQAATRITTSLDSLLWDFIPLPGASEATGRDVLLATIPIETADRIRHVALAADLELHSITLSSIASAELIARAERGRRDDPQKTSLVVARHGHRVEISVVRGECVPFTHSTLLSGDEDSQHVHSILAEISRSRVALERLHVGSQFDRAWVLGDAQANQALLGPLGERLGCEVRTLDPLADSDVTLKESDTPGSRALYAGPVGMLLAQTAPAVAHIDFLHPRRPAPVRDLRKLRVAMAAAGVLLLIAAAIGGVKLRAANLDEQIARLTEQERSLAEKVEAGTDEVESAGLIGEWTSRQIRWLERFREIADTLPGTERVYLTDVRGDVVTGQFAGRVQATGYARQRHDVEVFSQKLVDGGYRVHPQEITTSRRDASYPFRFTLEVDLVPEAEEETETSGLDIGSPAAPRTAVR